MSDNTEEKLKAYSADFINEDRYLVYLTNWIEKRVPEWQFVKGSYQDEGHDEFVDEYISKKAKWHKIDNGKQGEYLLNVICEYITEKEIKKLYASLRKKRSLDSKKHSEEITTIAVTKGTRGLIKARADEFGMTVEELLREVFKWNDSINSDIFTRTKKPKA